MTVLVHSRFRHADRTAALERALSSEFAGIVISTQVIEAGVDLSSRTLITELAPWASIVQRCGRCNRGGELADAEVWWVDHEDLEKSAPPYEAAEMGSARKLLSTLDSANPATLETACPELEPPIFEHVVRQRDVLDLFDTTPDLSGADVDVSRFIREGDERDVKVFWRDAGTVEAAVDPDRAPGIRPEREELCSVPVYELRRFLERPDRPIALRKDALAGIWRRVTPDSVFPGLTLLLRAEDGGYESTTGWIASSRVPVDVATAAHSRLEDEDDENDGDPLTEVVGQWISLSRHSRDTREAALEITTRLESTLDGLCETIALAAQVHDLGKAHPVFVRSMRALGGASDQVWAKSQSRGRLRHERRGFRHELASALAWLQEGVGPDRDLVAYLLATHHGKVRLSIRSMPYETEPPSSAARERLFARGVWHGDELPAVDLAGVQMPSVALDLTPMRLGRGVSGEPSWADRAAALLERFGPFRLAFLESLVRAADVRASIREES